jgi:hypothetical protein
MSDWFRGYPTILYQLQKLLWVKQDERIIMNMKSGSQIRIRHKNILARDHQNVRKSTWWRQVFSLERNAKELKYKSSYEQTGHKTGGDGVDNILLAYIKFSYIISDITPFRK